MPKKDFRADFLLGQAYRTDEYLPFDDDKLSGIIILQNNENKQKFKDTQRRFVPPLHIKDLSQSDQEWDGAWRRLPLIGKGEILGYGQETIVTKRTLAKESVGFGRTQSEFFKIDHAENPVVAVKSFPSTRYNAWAKEIGNLRRLHQAKDPHPDIQFCFEGLSIAKRGYIFSLAVDCNLEQMFQGSVTESGPRSSLFTPSSLLSKAIELAGGLLWLHDRAITKDNKRMAGNIHEDIKPKNILVFWRSEKGAIYGWRWKITDFGESSIGHHAPTHANDGRFTIYTDVKVRSGEYQPPEKEISDRVGTSTDIWSFGCTLFDLLVFTCGGPKKVRAFQDLRNLKKPNAFHEAVPPSLKQKEFKLRNDLLQFQEDQENQRFPAESSSNIWPHLWRALVVKILNPLPNERPKAEEVVEELRHLDSRLHRMEEECSYMGKAISEAPQWAETTNFESQRNEVDNRARNQPTHRSSFKHSYTLCPQPVPLCVEGCGNMKPDAFLLPVGKQIVQFSRNRDQDSLYSDYSAKEYLKIVALKLPQETISSSVSSRFVAILVGRASPQVIVYGPSSAGRKYENVHHPFEICCSPLGSFAALFPDRRTVLFSCTSDQVEMATIRSTGEELISAAFSCEGNHIYMWSYSNQSPRRAYWEMFEAADPSPQSPGYQNGFTNFALGQHTSEMKQRPLRSG